MKKQLFELLSALCVYSPEGLSRAIDALENYRKVCVSIYHGHSLQSYSVCLHLPPNVPPSTTQCASIYHIHKLQCNPMCLHLAFHCAHYSAILHKQKKIILKDFNGEYKKEKKINKKTLNWPGLCHA